ncbi:MAG TPA: XRE family transcriptional regulator [Deltaproteobacteria bacterium]|nr:XRE family transcriptional regulator [Deltaproteobacteria bacterium]
MKRKISWYIVGHKHKQKGLLMAKRNIQMNLPETFGNRMARLRISAGYSQRDLAAKLGISQRMIAYYEKVSQYPPAHILPILANALGVTADQMLWLEECNTNRKAGSRLWRRLSVIERMEPKEKRQIIQLLDSFIEREQLKKKTGT